MKKLISLLLAVCMLVCAMPVFTLHAGAAGPKQVYSCSFETAEELEEWTLADTDGDGYNWIRMGPEDGFEEEDWDIDGAYALLSYSYKNGVGILTPDNSAYTPEITIPAEGGSWLSYLVFAVDPDYCAEPYSVYVNVVKTGETKLLLSETLTDGEDCNTPLERSLDLTEFAGKTVRIQFRHHDVSDVFAIGIDQVEVWNKSAETSSENITMYTETPYKYVFLNIDDHDYEMYSCKLVSGALPEGLKWGWSAEGAYFYGTPTEEGNFTLQYRCVRGDDSSVLLHTVNLTVMKEEHSEDITMNVGEKYNIYLDLDDHFHEMYSCKLLSGILPKGLDWSWSAEGAHIYGTPTEEGDFVLRFKCVRGDDESTFYHTVNLHVQTPWDNPFVDVSESDWFYKDVKYAYLHGLMYGIDDTHFGPKRPTTRGMIVAILYRMTGSPTISSTCPFTDVKAGSYYEKAIIWASQNGIVYGVGNNKFAPDTNITREQMATFLCRYAKYLDVYDEDDCTTLAGFADSSKVASWAEASMRWAVGTGMISGSAEKDGVYLMPQGNATRCQAAAILHRFLVQFD